ncbi:TonB-dependent receptor [Sphingobium sp. JS3065]|uniref:TonB-dependent receptor n=1 Tax=Sphingobium sp. JS3065 TaxID=2970925 RepID=UPI002263E6CD|nr:TonB-dependent receptor [Sphingobium sp. JS3065]UZW56427.1 TonB-dependent receptor [Sphingobium sp. JS3065]
MIYSLGKFTCSVSVIALGFGVLTGAAHGQQNTDAAAEGAGGIVDILVTARKRSESAQSVPVAVTAISAETIVARDLTSLERIAAATPTLTVARASTGSGAQITMRGVGSSSTSIGIEQSVATVVDGVYYGQGRTINEGFFDLARVEVLKGPQALFFGKNATAGLISITTADPTDKTEIIARAGYEFKSQQIQTELIGSMPLSDTFGIRVALRGSKMFGGYYNNISTPFAFAFYPNHIAQPADSETPGERELLGRITLKWEPTSDITNTIKLSGTHSKVNNAGWNSVIFYCPTGVSQLNGQACRRDFVTRQNNLPSDIAPSIPFASKDGSLFNRYKSYAATNTFEWNLGDVSLTNVTNYNWNNNRFLISADLQSNPFGGIWTTENSTYHAFSNEFRVQTQYDGPVNVMAGGMYLKTRRDYAQYNVIANVEDATQPLDTRYLTNYKISYTDGETLAGFGQVTWKFLPKLEIAGGVRYTHETKDSYFTQPYVTSLIPIFRPQNSADGLGVVTANQVFNDWSPEFTLTWKPIDDIMVYGAYKTNYKSGGFSNGGINSLLSSNPQGDFAFGAEKARGFEVGLKSTLLDRQLRLNLNAYSYKYADLQVDYFNSAVFAYQTLTADARTKGVDLDFEFAPRSVSGLNVHGSVSYNKAKYTSFFGPCFTGQTPSEGCLFANSAGALPTGAQIPAYQDLAGQPLSVAPHWTGSLGIGYEIPVGHDHMFGVSVDGRYSSGYLASGFAQPDSRQGSYATLDASVRFGAEDGRWELAVIGKNLTNQFYIQGAFDAASTGAGTGTAAGVRADQAGLGALPRTVQVRLSTRF